MENIDETNSNDTTSFSSSWEASHEQTPTPSPKKSKRGWIILAIMITLLLVGGGITLYYLHEQDSEATAYSVLTDNETISDYEDYLRKFPQGVHASDVKARLVELQTMYNEWERVKRSSYKSDYTRFMDTYPNSILVKQCSLKIDSLDWIAAVQTNTTEGIETYLRTHPEGRYLSEATIALGNLQNLKVAASDVQNIAATLRLFYDAFAENDDATLCTCITPTMKQFLSKRNVTKAEVVDLVNNTHSEHILSCTFILNNDYESTKMTTADGQTVYKVKFTVDQHITRDNEGKTFGSYTAEVELTGQFKISSLTMTEISRKEQE